MLPPTLPISHTPPSPSRHACSCHQARYLDQCPTQQRPSWVLLFPKHCPSAHHTPLISSTKYPSTHSPWTDLVPGPISYRHNRHCFARVALNLVNLRLVAHPFQPNLAPIPSPKTHLGPLRDPRLAIFFLSQTFLSTTLEPGMRDCVYIVVPPPPVLW